MWCTATRYDCDFYVSKRHIEVVLHELEIWFQDIRAQLSIE